MSNRLHDKNFVVVGGTSGIGLAAVRAFHAEGARIVVVGRNKQSCDRLEKEFGDSVRTVAGDARSPATADLAIELALKTYGNLHGLFHVAGGSGRKEGDGPLHELREEGWNFTVEWNLKSAFYSNQAAVRQFLQQKSGGSILNCGSVLASSPSPKFFATHAYAAAKAGLEGLSRAAASYYAPKGIRVNVLAAGLIATPMSARAQSDPAILDYAKIKQPLDGGRLGDPEDLAGAAVWLMSDESRFVTGQVIAVDGGWSISEAGNADGSNTSGD